MNNTLLVEIEQSVQDLRHVQGNQVFRKLAEVLADAVQRAILAILQDDVQAVGAAHKALVFDNIGVVQVLEQVDFHLHVLQVGGAQVLEAHLLDGNRLAGAPVEGAVNAAKGAFAQAVAELVVLEADNILGGPLCCSVPARALFALFAAFARLGAVVGRGRGLLLVAWRAWVGGWGLRGARVGGPVRGLWGVVRHHGGRALGVSLVAFVWPAASCRDNGSRGGLLLPAACCLIRTAACVCSRRRSKAVSAVVAGVGRGVGRAFLLVQIDEAENAVKSCAVVVCACASRAASLAGSVADALVVIWRSQAARVLGIPAAKGDGRGVM